MTCSPVPRTWTEINPHENGADKDGKQPRSGPLKDYQGCPALVLLGAPGAGKTTCLRQEEKEGRGHYVKARDFTTFEHSGRLEGQGGPLLIDGLDEVRAGAQDDMGSLDKIRAKLEKLGFPDFRLSCRETAWLGMNDWNDLRCEGAYSDLCVVRLNPLSKKDMLKILPTVPNTPNPRDFIKRAEDMGFDSFLENPLRLMMLARAVGEGGWLESRTKVFKRACKALLVEKNPKHQAAERNSAHTRADLLDLAGEMCALQLLSGTAGWDINPASSNKDFPALEGLGVEDIRGCRHVLGTKLFTSVDDTNNTGRFAIHRQVAEYLGARFLKGRLRKGLPLGRILALMTSNDGMVVGPLQGLAAWLAALCPEGREELVARNPLGTALDGDLSAFSPTDKIGLLRHLRKEADRNPWFWRVRAPNSRMDDLLSEDLADEIRKEFEVASDDIAGQGFALFLAQALYEGKRGALSEGLASVLFSGLRGNEWRAGLRKSVLGILIRHMKGKQDRKQLIDLLRDFGNGNAPDHDDDLAGRLLRELYPDVIGVSEILDYLQSRRDEDLIGNYYYFWMHDLSASNILPEQRCKLLDVFVKKFADEKQRSSQEHHDFEKEVFLALLKKHLQESGDDTEKGKIFAWLEVSEWGWGDFRRVGEEELHGIRQWLRPRLELRKSLFKRSFDQHAGNGNPNEEMFKVEDFLFANHKPADFGGWCLEQIKDTDNLSIAHYFARRVAWSIHYQIGVQSLPRKDEIEARIKSVPGALEAFHEHLRRLSQDQACEDREAQERAKKRADKRANRRKELAQYAGELRENRAPPELLHNLATAYFGGYADIAGGTPRDRLLDFTDGDEQLVEAILIGLRSCVDRDDLPSVEEAIDSISRHRKRWLVWPFMAGMEELAHESHGNGFPVSEDKIYLAFVIHYAGMVPNFIRSKFPPYPPSWYDPALVQYPECAKKSLITATRILMRTRRSMQAIFKVLVERKDHRKIARDILTDLLKSFPVRCSQDQMNDLKILLRGARIHYRKQVILSLVKRKTELASMNVMQRVFWLGEGLRLAPRSYLKKMEIYIGDNRSRIAYLLRAFATGQGQSDTEEVRDTGALSLLIKLGGSLYRPWATASYRHNPVSTLPWAFEPDLIAAWIKRLSSLPSNEATEAFKRLKDDDRLQPWLPTLQDAAYRQELLLAGTRSPNNSPSEVLATLRNREPANPADLKALATEEIKRLARRIRGGNTNDWEQYWDIDGKEPVKPHHEDLCRNAFLSDLESALKRFDVDSKPEGIHPDRRRADIELTHPQAGEIPIEVKRSNSRDLWSAIRNQLIPRYTRMPESNGHGIYLVFWFGKEHCQRAPNEKQPEKACELQKMLEGSLSEAESRKVSICVVDVASPFRS